MKKRVKSTPHSPKEAASPNEKSTFNWTAVLRVILWIVLIVIGISYYTTGTWFFTHNPRKLIPKEPRLFTVEDLAQYDGSDPNKPIYLAIKGKVFDVSSGSRHYGKGGGYSFFAGKDASRSYVTGCFKTHLTHDLRGFTQGQMNELDNWLKFFENHKEYFYVGTVDNPEIDPNSPIPEDCNQ